MIQKLKASINSAPNIDWLDEVISGIVKDFANSRYNFLFAFAFVIIIYAIEILVHLVNNAYPFELKYLGLINYTGGIDSLNMFLLGLGLSFFSYRVRTALMVLIFFMVLQQILHFEFFGTYVQPISFYLFFIESGEVASSFLAVIGSMILPFSIVIFAGFFLFLLSNKSRHNLVRYSKMPALFILCIALHSWGVYRKLNTPSGKLWHVAALSISPVASKTALTNYFRSLVYFSVGVLPKKVFGSIEQFSAMKAPLLKKDDLDVNIIFVLGESLRAQQLSLLGYSKNNTTPLLSEVEGLVSKSIFASGTMTKTATAGILNRLKYPGVTSQIAHQDNCLFKLAKNNNFETHYITAQNENMSILENIICKKYIDNYVKRPAFKKDVSPFDYALVQYLDNVDFSKNNFLLLNQRGSHFFYEQQYPSNFKKFDLAYDNTVLYTDYVLANLIKRIKEKSKKKTYIIYTSDHGELLGEKNMRGHGWFEEEVYKVPFLFYAINGADNYAEDLSHIISHFDMSTLIAKLLGYDVEVDKNEMKHVYVNGSDIDALAGYMHLKVNKSGKIISSKIVN